MATRKIPKTTKSDRPSYKYDKEMKIYAPNIKKAGTVPSQRPGYNC